MKRLRPLLGCALLVCPAMSAWAGALDQAGQWAGPNYRPPTVPTPRAVCVANCGTTSQTVPRTTTTKAPSYGYKPSMAVGAAVFGSLLESVLFAPAESAPDPEVLRRQEEERRLAFVAVTRAKEELIITRPKKIMRQWDTYEREAQPSRFVSEMGLVF